MNEHWLKFFPHVPCLSVDESMIAYFGRHSCKQYIRGKPIKFGYKAWSLNTPSGYLIQSQLYQGAQKEYEYPALGLGGSVVVSLASLLPKDLHYRLYFDNFFTSLPLLEHLSTMNCSGTGTLRANRTEGAPLKDSKLLEKEERGTFDYRTDIENNAITVK